VHEIVLDRIEGDTEYYRVTDWEPVHVAFTPDPADPTVGVDRNLNINEQLNNNQKEKVMDPVTNTQERTLSEQEIAALTSQIKKEVSADKQAAVDRAIQDGGEKALLNVHGIITMARDFKDKVKGVDLIQLADDFAFKLKADQGDFQKLIIRNLADQQPAGGVQLGLTPKEVKKFSFRNLIMSQDPKSGVKADFELETCREYAKKLGVTPQGMLVPTDILLRERTLVTSTTTAGGYLVADNLLPQNFIEMVRNKAVSDQLGAMTLDGLVGDVLIPKQTGAGTFSWMSSEVSGPAGTDMTFDQVSLTPKLGTSNTAFSRKLLLQATPSIDMLVENDLAKIAAIGEDLAFFHGTGASGQPTGIALASGIGGGSKPGIDYSGIVSLETDVAAANLDVASMFYVTNATIRGTLKTREKVSGYPQFIWEGNQMNGYPCKVSNQISTGYIFFGDFSQAIKARWNGLDIVVDPYTYSTSGYIRVTVFIYVDVGVRNAGAFAVATGVN